MNTTEEFSVCSIAAHRKKNENTAKEDTQQFGRIATSENKGEIAKNGAFVRQKNRFSTPFGDKEGELPIEAGRVDQIDFEGLWSAPQDRKKLSRTPDEKFRRHPKGETPEEYKTVIQPSRWNIPGVEI